MTKNVIDWDMEPFSGPRSFRLLTEKAFARNAKVTQAVALSTPKVAVADALLGLDTDARHSASTVAQRTLNECPGDREDANDEM